MTDRPRRSVLVFVLTMLLTGCGVASSPGSGGPTGTSGTTTARPSTPVPDAGMPARSAATAQGPLTPAPDPPAATSSPPPPRATPTSSPPTATPSTPPPVPKGLPSEWGVAFLSPGGEVTVLGTLRHGAAWSTIKVPLAVAALREHGASVSAQAHAALSWSDNNAAGQLWTDLGPPDVAGAAVDGVLRSLGDPATTTQTQQVRAPFSPFGQTDWTLEGQVRTARGLWCGDDPAAAPVLESMSQVVPDQAWGLGRIDDAHFKGGWGPGPEGRYLVRQVGLVPLGDQTYPVALAARADDGSFASGTATLDLLAGWWADALVEQAAPTGCDG